MKKNQFTIIVKSITLLMWVSAILTLASCSGNARKIEIGIPIEFSKSDVNNLFKNIPENKDKLLSIKRLLSYTVAFAADTNPIRKVEYKNQFDFKELEEHSAPNMSATYIILAGTGLMLIGIFFGYKYAQRKGTEFRFKPIALIIIILLFLISLYGAITGKPYNEILPFIG